MNARVLPIALVAAVARNGVIGAGGTLPWRLPSDLRHFKAMTLGRPVVMGRKTFESIGRVLPGRRTIVVSRRPGFRHAGVEAVDSLQAAITLAQCIGRSMGAAEIAVAGGGGLFAEAIGFAAALHITEVEAAPSGDVWFPAIDPETWCEVSREPHDKSGDDEAAFAFVEYVRR